mmetsp:Transcript_14479/g.39227  ORF Transcript_14479/g.39227 Transcript_14479/m.39227 type:complete len:248 (+) Transcript_14479:1241-1984(+)
MVSMHVHQRAVAHGHLHLHREGHRQRVHVGLDVQRRREPRVDAPHAHGYIPRHILQSVGRHDLAEVEGPLAIPQPLRQCRREEVLAHHEIFLVMSVDCPDRVAVGDNCHMALRHPLSRPSSGLAFGTGGNLKDPCFLRIRDRDRLTSARGVAVKAVLFTHVAHGLDSAPGRPTSLQCDLHRLVRVEEVRGVRLEGLQTGIRRSLAKGHAVLVHDRVGRFPVGISVRNLRDVPQRLGCGPPVGLAVLG